MRGKAPLSATYRPHVVVIGLIVVVHVAIAHIDVPRIGRIV